MKSAYEFFARIALGLFATVAMTGAALAGNITAPPTQAPEPGTLAVLAGGVATAIYLRRRNRKK